MTAMHGKRIFVLVGSSGFPLPVCYYTRREAEVALACLPRFDRIEEYVQKPKRRKKTKPTKT